MALGRAASRGRCGGAPGWGEWQGFRAERKASLSLARASVSTAWKLPWSLPCSRSFSTILSAAVSSSTQKTPGGHLDESSFSSFASGDSRPEVPGAASGRPTSERSRSVGHTSYALPCTVLHCSRFAGEWSSRVFTAPVPWTAGGDAQHVTQAGWRGVRDTAGLLTANCGLSSIRKRETPRRASSTVCAVGALPRLHHATDVCCRESAAMRRTRRGKRGEGGCCQLGWRWVARRARPWR